MRCFDEHYYQFATSLGDLEEPVSKGYSPSVVSEGYTSLHRRNYDVTVSVNGLTSFYGGEPSRCGTK